MLKQIRLWNPYLGLRLWLYIKEYFIVVFRPGYLPKRVFSIGIDSQNCLFAAISTPYDGLDFKMETVIITPRNARLFAEKLMDYADQVEGNQQAVIN